MFICEQCKRVLGPKVSPHKVVVETRVVDHPQRWSHDENGDKADLIDKGGRGTQVVKELVLCAECAKSR